jgi:hypothetical protein
VVRIKFVANYNGKTCPLVDDVRGFRPRSWAASSKQRPVASGTSPGAGPAVRYNGEMWGKWLALLLVAAGTLAAQAALTYNQLSDILKSSVSQGLQDREVAGYLKNQKLSFALTDALIEEFQGWGIGPRTLAVLADLKTATVNLPAAAIKQPEPEPPGPPPPSKEEQERIIAEARHNALTYTEGLPDYICLQVTRRFVDPSGLEMSWLKYDEIKTRVSYVENRENYEVISVDNRPVDKGIHELGGATSSGEFGTMLREVFDPGTRTEFSWARHSLLRGRGVYVFGFRVARGRSGWRLTVQPDEYVAGYSGLVYIDKESERVMRLYMKADNIPSDFPMQEAQSRLDYDFIEISGNNYLLPLRARVRLRQGKILARNEVEFRLYRKFSAETTISFDEIDNLAPLPEEPPTSP